MRLDYRLSYGFTPSIVAKSAFFYMQSVGHFKCRDDYCTQREGYRSYLLIYTVEGKGCARYRGKQYMLGKGQVLLMDCYEYQEYFTAPDEFWEIKWLHFNGSSSTEYFNIIYDNYGPVIDIGTSPSISCYLDSLLRLADEKDIQLELKASGVIAQMLTDILLEASTKLSIYNRKDHNVNVEKAIDYIEKNYSANISLEDISHEVCSSKFHFSRVFKRITGYSPYEYLLKYRINQAKNLLRSSGSSVDEVAQIVGFDSTSNFIRTFRQLEEITPLRYRKYWRGN